MKHRLALSAALAVLLACGVLLLVSTPPEQNGWLPQCPVHAATGLHCPGCGATRGLYALMQGDIRSALRKNALLILLLPWLAFSLLRFWLHWLRQTPAPPPRRSWWLPLAAILLFTVLRNVPSPPFSWLAPH